jgi:hypothetical protein
MKFSTKVMAHRQWLAAAAFLLLGFQTFAQTDADRRLITRNYNKAELQKMEQQADAKAKRDKEEAVRVANQKGYPLSIRNADGTVSELQRLAADGTPLYYRTYNLGAAKTTRANTLNSGGSLGLNVNGQNMIAGVWDGGAVRAAHTAFGTRVSQRDGVTFTTPDDNNGHATHVAGTVMASLSAGSGNARGMAYEATCHAYDWNNDVSEATSAASSGMLLSNHSYGYGVIDYNGNLQIPVHMIGKYVQDAADWDNIMYNAPFYQMVNAAGNDRDYQARITNKGGYDLLTGHSVAKNAIVVGAVRQVDNYTGPSSVVMSSFSNWGPTDDGRIKPDICGKGVGVYSTYSSSNTSFATLDGTSMASPNVTGTLLLLQQHHRNVTGNFMYASMLRGLAIHTADEAGPNLGPDYMFGWGLLNAQKAAQTISTNGTASLMTSQVLNAGATYTVTVTASGTQPLEVTICWTDPAGAPITNTTVDPTTLALRNDLDVRVLYGTQTFSPWVLNPANRTAAATTGDNFRDNVEKIYIANPVAGATYTIRVTHKGTSLVGNSQRFSLIATGLGTPSTGGGGSTGGGTTTPTYCASKGNDASYEWIAGVRIGSFNNASTAAQSSAGYTNYTNITVTATTGNTAITLTPGFASTAYNESWRIWIDLNRDGDFDDAGEQAFASALSSAAVTGNLVIPSTAAGITTRMRVSMKYDATQTPCETFGYGEVEDYTITINAASGGGTTGPGPAPTTYCASRGTNNTYEWIDYVAIGGMTNTTSKENNGYGNYTATRTGTVTRGSSTTLTYSAAFSGTAYTEYWSIWIDYNRDGDFADAGELVASRASSSAANLSSTITIPTTASTGFTRMRVVMKDKAYATDACQTFTYGEVEDYQILIVAPPALEAQPDLVDLQDPGQPTNEQAAGNSSLGQRDTEAGYVAFFPNPAQEAIFVMIDRRNGPIDYQIFSTDGKLMLTGQLQESEQQINLHSLPAGMYILHMNDAQERWTNKIMKR